MLCSQQGQTAYRQLTGWCWEWLGRKVSVVLPSRAVNKIRNRFPSEAETGVYVGYNDANINYYYFILMSTCMYSSYLLN